jgi:hypothetical protein
VLTNIERSSAVHVCVGIIYVCKFPIHACNGTAAVIRLSCVSGCVRGVVLTNTERSSAVHVCLGIFCVCKFQIHLCNCTAAVIRLSCVSGCVRASVLANIERSSAVHVCVVCLASSVFALATNRLTMHDVG